MPSLPRFHPSKQMIVNLACNGELRPNATRSTTCAAICDTAALDKLPSCPSSSRSTSSSSCRNLRDISSDVEAEALEQQDALLTCTLCLSQMRPDAAETFACGAHSCCKECASKTFRTQVRGGKLPRCFEPTCCSSSVDLGMAQRLLSAEDYQLYLDLALWSNLRVETCPLCCVLLYREIVPRSPAVVECPACFGSFCDDCRCPAHTGFTCEEALCRFEENASWRQCLVCATDDSKACHEGAPSATRSEAGVFEDAGSRRLRVCPRCRAVVEKADKESCDHVTCISCSHEFCWDCLADRSVIYAHGNHHHRRGCMHYAPYSGKDEYLPERCGRCRLRGSACSSNGGDVASILDLTCSCRGEALAAIAQSLRESGGVIAVSVVAEVSEAASRWAPSLLDFPWRFRWTSPGCMCALPNCGLPIEMETETEIED